MSAHIVTTLADVTPHALRLESQFDGVNPDSDTISFAQLMSFMVPGPLKGYWEIRGLTAGQAHLRFLHNLRMRYTQLADPFYGFGIDVGVDGDGSPTLIIAFPIKDNAIHAFSTLEFRHTHSR